MGDGLGLYDRRWLYGEVRRRQRRETVFGAGQRPAPQVCSTVSIQKLCVGQLFCVGAALVAAHPRATTRVAPTAAPALSGYERLQVGVFLLPPLMHRFTVDTVVACAMRTKRGALQCRRAELGGL